MGLEGTIVFDVVVGARFLIPLLIIRFPLPAILAALVLDGVDQTIFQSFGFDPPGYQSYDKAMDVYYLAIAYLSTMRNWTSQPALAVAKFLYFYRLVGVTAFELTQWRPLLLIFPNTFEYFFIAYEIIRLRRDPIRRSRRFWVVTAAAIWIFVKLPQEYWIHVAQLDVTDTVAKYPEAAAVIAVIAVVLGLVAWLVVRRHLPPADWSWRVQADPLPADIDTAAERDRWAAAHTRVLSMATAEKIVLVGLISIIYGEILPERRSSNLQLFLGIAVFVVVNAAISLWIARRFRTLQSTVAAFGARVVLNIVLVLLGNWLLGRSGGDIDPVVTLFFVLLFSLITLLDDRYRPVAQVRFAGAQPRPPIPSRASPESRRSARPS